VPTIIINNTMSSNFPLTVPECCLIKLLPYILFKNIFILLLLEMASPGNQHCANCIGTLSFPTYKQQTKSAKDLTVRSASSTLEWMDPRRSEVSLMKSLGSSRGSQGARSAAWTDTKSTSVSGRGFYCPDSASSLYKGSASLNGTIKLSACA